MTITQDSNAPLFVVIGSTGMQGTSVINALRVDKEAYRVRAVTRDVSKPAAVERKTWGCEIVVADVEDLDTLTNVFRGADIAFGMTNPGFAPGVTDPFAKEFQEGKNIVDAAKAEGVKTLIFAGLPSLQKVTGGKYSADPWEAKAKVVEYARGVADNDFRLVDVWPGYYAQNFYTLMAPRKQPDGSFAYITVNAEDKPLPVIDVEEDYGHFVLAALHGNVETLVAASEYVTREQIIATLHKVSNGNTISVLTIPPAALEAGLKAQVGEPAASAIVNMFAAGGEFEHFGGPDLAEGVQLLSRPPRTFEQSILAYKDRFAQIFV